jgi:hypothetical protein
MYCQGKQQIRERTMILPGGALQSLEGFAGIIQFQVINADWGILVIEVIKQNEGRT